MKITDLMKFIKGFFSETNQLKRVIVYAAIALALVITSFGAYYYWDRYVHLGDQSPVTKSIQELEGLVRKHPEDVDLRIALAESYMADKNYNKAIEQASQVLSAHSDNDRAMFVTGVSYASQGKSDLAIDPLKKFVEIRSKTETAKMDNALETALYYLGDSYISLGSYQDAIPALSQAVQINATDSDAFYLLGVAYGKSGQHEKAIENYQEAVRFVPNFAEAYKGMTESYTALNKADYASYARGMLAFSSKDYKTARVELEKATVALPDYAPAFIGLGLTYEELGDLQSAKTNLEHALQIDPNDFTASQALGRVQAALQK